MTIPPRIFISCHHYVYEELVSRIKADSGKRRHDASLDENKIKVADVWRRSITEVGNHGRPRHAGPQLRMVHGLYSLARKELGALMADPTQIPSQTQSLLKELGREALAENGHWLLCHRERPPRLPHVEG